MDVDGYVYFIDRIKGCIRRRGENISSFEIEQVVGEHPAVAEGDRGVTANTWDREHP